MRRLLRAAPRLGRDHWRDLLSAQWLLLRALVRLRARPTGALLDERPVDGVDASLGVPADRAVVERAAWAIDRVAAVGPLRARCLARAIALRDLLARRGVAGARVRVGVRRTGKGLDAHAWVELRGHVIGEHADHVRQFAPLPGLALVDER